MAVSRSAERRARKGRTASAVLGWVDTSLDIVRAVVAFKHPKFNSR